LRGKLFMALQRNALRAPDQFEIPPNRVIEPRNRRYHGRLPIISDSCDIKKEVSIIRQFSPSSPELPDDGNLFLYVA
jgi:hypothetical protein